VVGPLADEAARRPEQLSKWELSNVLWAVAQLRHPHPQLFAVAERHAIPAAAEAFDPITLSVFMYSYAKARCPATQLCDTVDALVPVTINRFDSQALANIAWAFAKQREPGAAVFTAIAGLVRARPDVLRARDLVCVIWACGRLGHRIPPILEAVEELFAEEHTHLHTQSLANAVQAFAKLDNPSPRVFQAVRKEVLRRNLSSFRNMELATIAWAFDKMGLGDDELFDAIHRHQAHNRDIHANKQWHQKGRLGVQASAQGTNFQAAPRLNTGKPPLYKP